jgi:phytoene synthase
MRDAIERRDGYPFPAAAPTLAEAERRCAALARREAKNLYWGFVALPREQRTAIYALYDFAHQVDDQADRGDRPVATRTLLRQQRERLRRCLAGECDDAVTQVLSSAIGRYAIPAEELFQVVEGVEMDVERTRYLDWAELETYCRLVASSVGRMCMRIFGSSDPGALRLADDLCVAMQLTNILRDIREDLDLGRIYLPLEDLARFSLTEERLVEGLERSAAPPGWAELLRFEARRARARFATGIGVTRYVPRSSGACVRTMAGIYQRILGRIERDPDLPLRGRISLHPSRKLVVALGSWLQAA